MLGEIGSGGEGSVFLVLHETTGQLRAVKRVRKKNCSGGLRDVNALRFLRHSGLPQMIEVIEEETYYWIVMSYVRGKSLQQIMDIRHRLPCAKVVDAGEQICSVLMYLHSRKVSVLHLDLKPANIMVGLNGKLVLLDFGSALRTEKKSICPGEGERIGTDGFAPPELYQPDAPVDVRSDIYELGAVLYYLISGMIFSPACIKSHVPGCPDELEKIIRRCLQPDPGMRYASVRELHADLKRIAGRKHRRRRREIGWVAMLMVIICAGIAMRAVSASLAKESSEVWDRSRILEEASCVGGQQKTELYLRAAMLAPQDAQVYEQIIDEAAQDGRMDSAELSRITSIFRAQPPGSGRTYEELFSENSSEYAKVCLQIGLLCRYALDNEIREAAGGWLGKAMRGDASSGENGTGPGRIASLINELESAERSGRSGSKQEKQLWQIRQELICEETCTWTGQTIFDKMADRALDSLVLSAANLLKEGVGEEEIRESAAKFAGYNRETGEKNRQRLELIDHMLGVSEGKEKAAWEKVTE